MAGNHAEAIDDLTHALALSQVEDTRVRNLIRIGTAQFYGGDHNIAETTLREALEAADTLGDEQLRGFAHQHLGKCLAEMERLDEARGQFMAALEIRERLESHDLTQSTRQAIAALDARPGGRRA